MKSILAGLLVALLATAFVLAGLELGMRVLGLGDDAIAQPDPWVGWVHIPRLKAEVHSEDPALGRRMPLAFDSLGLRDVERAVEKPPGTYRVLLLGDSFVEAAQVPFDSMLSRRLERELNARSSRRVEVWNCGVAGYSTAQELLYLRRVAARFQPDLVILCFLASNDVADEVPELATSLRNRAFLSLRQGRLMLNRSFFRADPVPVAWLRTHSRLFGWVTTQVRVLKTNLRERRKLRPGASGVPSALMIYAERPDTLWAGAWALAESSIVEAGREAERHGARFLLVSIASGAQVHPQGRTNRPGWESWEKLPGLSLEAPEARLTRLAHTYGLDYLPLLYGFRAEAETGARLHIGWVGHWNSAGHALAARLIARHLEELRE